MLISILHLFAQSFEKGQLYVYVLNPTSIPTFVKDGEKIIVQCSNQELQSILSQYKVYSFEKAFPIVEDFRQKEKYNLERVYLLKCDGDEIALSSQLNENFTTHYDYTESVPHFEMLATPNDYHLLDNTLGPNYALDIINAKDAWDISTGSSTTVVGIIDTGFEVDLPELMGKAFSVSNNTSTNKTHGTFVAGIVGANTNNGLGISSIGYDCKLALRGQGGWDPMSDILALSTQGIRVINFSLGSYGSSTVHENIINLAYDNGTIVVASAGNDNTTNYMYPASYYKAISVSSVGEDLKHASTCCGIHNHNDRVDVCAAGYGVISIGKYDNQPIYYKSSGTSFAAPYVTGLIGLILTVNPNLHPDLVTHIVKSTTQDIYSVNTQYTGLLGTGLIDAHAALLKAQEISTIGADYEVFNGQNLVWNAGDLKVVNNYIKIHPGGTLTIEGEVYLKENAIITIDRGGKLTLDGATLSSYNSSNWEGIQVWGNRLLDQIPSTNQGFLSVKNGTLISNANRAIQVGKGMDGVFVYNYGGGILELESSTLLNNKLSVVFAPYRRTSQQFELYNKSYIRNTEFIWNIANINGMVFLTLNDVNLNEIAGNRFLNNNAVTSVPNEANGIGIQSYSANFAITSYQSPNGQVDSYFYHLHYGIKSEASSPTQTFKVENTTFNNVFNGIYTNGSNGLRIVNNIFEPLNYPDIPTQLPTCFGLYMNNCTGYTINNNHFRNINNSASIRKIIGIIVNNSGSAYNLINDNSFSNLKVGVLAQNQNRGSLTPETGLVIKCNYFTHNKNDVAVTGTQNGQGYGIGYYQGTNTSTSSPAGNLFGHAFSGTTSDYHNELQNIVYVHHLPDQNFPELIPWYYTTSTISLANSMKVYNPGISCSLLMPTVKEELKSFVEEKEESANYLNQVLSESIDQGNTVQLENTVISSTPDESYNVYQELMQTGSYVSNSVLSSAIQKEDVLNETMIRDVLVSNPHAAKSPELMNLIGNRENQLPEYMMAQIEDGFNTLSARELLEQQISMQRLEASVAEKELIYLYKTDTTAPIDSLLLFLSSRNRPDAFIQLAFEYLKTNQIAEALNSINAINISDLGEPELELRNKMLDYLQFHSVLINEGRNTTELNNSEIAELEVLAEGDDLVASCTRSILIANGLLEYNEPILLPNEMFKSSKIERNCKIANNSQLNIYPNPASQWVTVEYNLQVIGSTNAVLEIVDATGRVVKTMKLSGNKNTIIVDLATLKKGIYFCNLVSDKHTTNSKKLSIQ